jgi:hypothetical protein
MVLHKLLIVQQGRVSANLLANFTMTVEEPVEIRHISAVAITIAIHVSAVGVTILPGGITIAQVVVAGVEIFQSHERVRLLADLLFHTCVVLKIGVELRMALQILRIGNQGRCLAKLVGNFAMAIEKLVKLRQVSASNVIAWNSLPVWGGRDGLPVLRG